MSELIRNKQDLISYLTTKKIASKNMPEYVNVTSQLRKSVLTDESQGSFIYKGRHTQFDFKNLGGGVYRASIKKERASHVVKAVGVIGGES